MCWLVESSSLTSLYWLDNRSTKDLGTISWKILLTFGKLLFIMTLLWFHNMCTISIFIIKQDDIFLYYAMVFTMNTISCKISITHINLTSLLYKLMLKSVEGKMSLKIARSSLLTTLTNEFVFPVMILTMIHSMNVLILFSLKYYLPIMLSSTLYAISFWFDLNPFHTCLYISFSCKWFIHQIKLNGIIAIDLDSDI